jgi:urea carboxylase
VDALLQATEATLPPASSMRVPSRVIRLPLAFEDSATLDAVARYSQTVRATAPYLPRNAEFMRRANGLGSVEEVASILYDATYLVLVRYRSGLLMRL